MTDTLDWLLDSDPAIRWQVLRDLTDASDDEVAAERAKVATEGWGAALLAKRDPDGQWAAGACFPGRRPDGIAAADLNTGQPWISTFPSLDLLRLFGLDPATDIARAMIDQVAANCHWEHDGQRFFDGEVEACINGRAVAIGAYFGHDVEQIVRYLTGRQQGGQLADGGWNCQDETGSTVSSFNSTLCVIEGLLAHEHATGGTAETIAARRGGEEYLLERALMRRKSTGDVPVPEWLQFSFPPQWHYDVLRALDHFRAAGGAADPRLQDAVALVRDKRQPDGRWLLENTHPGALWFDLEDGDGQPSRWNTLRALRVLAWAEAG